MPRTDRDQPNTEGESGMTRNHGSSSPGPLTSVPVRRDVEEHLQSLNFFVCDREALGHGIVAVIVRAVVDAVLVTVF